MLEKERLRTLKNQISRHMSYLQKKQAPKLGIQYKIEDENWRADKRLEQIAQIRKPKDRKQAMYDFVDSKMTGRAKHHHMKTNWEPAKYLRQVIAETQSQQRQAESLKYSDDPQIREYAEYREEQMKKDPNNVGHFYITKISSVVDFQHVASYAPRIIEQQIYTRYRQFLKNTRQSLMKMGMSDEGINIYIHYMSKLTVTGLSQWIAAYPNEMTGMLSSDRMHLGGRHIDGGRGLGIPEYVLDHINSVPDISLITYPPGFTLD